MFYPHDPEIYDELWDAIPATAVVKGQPQLVEDVFGFWLKDREQAGEEMTHVYRMRQVLADKVTGTGGGVIRAGMRLYALVNQNFAVSPTPGANPGVDSYFCGWAKEDAAADAERVLMNFDGTRWDENI